MRVIYVGCGVNVFSNLQNVYIQYVTMPRRPDKRSASGDFALVISLSAPSRHFINSLNEYLLPFHSRLFLICCFKNK
ncbi:TPA: hypothetical protein HL449_06040 [Escherichia coli]|uniref:Uncharacterized protein n=1 Tax=Escherichia coli TaxID=562 RepID=A0A2T3S154_ECOLX|nr:hypothetical protein Eco118UI_18840 [Escherichia coli]EFN8577734.1 hypothetical protein [Escherichia coli O15]EFO3119480.1 hypothetical protein [Escherichia coli O73]ESD87075.1 hypothetical protein HMPREF1613_03336 [Escherichia coli 908616]RWU68284.1 hypothetical protein EPS42_21650 [Shigella sonnei]THI73510.1 hypothetical protein FAZ84_03210 [Escherichia coli K-12]